MRVFGDTTTQTAGGNAFPYFDVCPEDQVLIGINGWTQPDASPSWLMRGQAVCGKIYGLFNCANGNKYPLADRSRQMKLAEMDAGSL